MNIETAQDVLENCRFCLMCRHVAPMGHVTNQEALTPHGLALTATSIERGLIDWNDETIGLMFSEVDGGNSRAHCVTDQPFEEALAVVRHELIKKDLAPAAVTALHDSWAAGRSPFGEKAPEHQLQTAEVGIFIGEESYFLRPQAVEAVVKLAHGVGLEPALIGVGQPSGLLAATAGLFDLARQQREKIGAQLTQSGVKRLLVMSAGDCYAFGRGFAERLGGDWAAEVAVSELLPLILSQIDERLMFKPVKITTPYAYVDPDHAVRVPERHDVPRQLLTKGVGYAPVELFWRRERAHPVGSTALQFSKPALAEGLTRARLEDAAASGAKLLFCEDAATLAQLEKHAAEYGLGVIGLYEWLADHLVARS